MSSRDPGTVLSPSEAIAEAIAAKDLNNLYLTSCYFGDREKYRAFCSLYAVMRVIDDRIDDLVPRGELSVEERAHEHEVARIWEQLFNDLVDGSEVVEQRFEACERPDAAALLRSAADAMRRFPVPRELWVNFFAAMHRDIDQRPFETFADFLEYTEGASVAPTTIYLYLIASAPTADGAVHELPAGFDLLQCGRHLGTFAYLGHILRDLARDLEAGENGLLYLAGDDLARFELTLDGLQEDRRRKRSSPELRRLVAEIAGRARESMQQGKELLEPLDDRLTADCTFILQLIVRIYERVIDKLESVDYDPMAGKHRLTKLEKYGIAKEIARPLGFSLVPVVAKPWAGLFG